MTFYNTEQHRRNRNTGTIDKYAISGISPLSISNLQAWFQTNREVGYSNGDGINQITDWSGNGYHMSGTGTYVVDSGICLIDSNEFENTTRPASGNNAVSFCIYGDTYNNDGTLFGIGAGGNLRYSLNVCIDYLYCWGDLSFTSMPTAAPWYVITVTYDGTTVRVYKNYDLWTTWAPGAFNIQTGIYMFRWWNNDRQSTLRARFGAVYSKNLSADEVSLLVDYASNYA